MDLLEIENEDTTVGNKWDVIKVALSANDVLLFYSALEKYRADIKKDIETQYDANPNYGLEDDAFLGELLGQVSRLMLDFDAEDRLKKYTLRP